MSEVYGKLAESFIHVHHLSPLKETGECIVDPFKDLVPLCPNCHSIVHLKSPPLGIAKLRKLIAQNLE